METTYVALKPLKIGEGTRKPGEEVPEAKDWRNVHNYISQGFLSVVTKPETDKKVN